MCLGDVLTRRIEMTHSDLLNAQAKDFISMVMLKRLTRAAWMKSF